MSELTPTSQVEFDSGTTLVKVRFTQIKFFNEEENKADTVKIIGKLTLLESREYIKTLNDSNVLISKLNIYEEFEVNTVELYQLKQD